MSKMESKSVRNLDLNFAALPRGKKNQQTSNNNEYYEEPVPEVKKPINPMNEQEFPMLSSNGAASSFSAPPRVTVANKIGKAGLAKTDENFPSLGPATSVPMSMSMPKIQKPIAKTTVAHALKPNHVTRPQEVKNVQNDRKKDTKKPSLQNNHVEKKDLYEDFPSLPVTKNLHKVLKFPAQNKSAANMIEFSTLAKAEPKLKLVNTENVQKSNEKPKPVSLNINSDDFPSLGGKSKQSENPISIREKDPKPTSLTTNKPHKNKINIKNLRKNDEITNNYSILQGTSNLSTQYIRPPNEENRNKVRNRSKA